MRSPGLRPSTVTRAVRCRQARDVRLRRCVRWRPLRHAGRHFGETKPPGEGAQDGGQRRPRPRRHVIQALELRVGWSGGCMDPVAHGRVPRVQDRLPIAAERWALRQNEADRRERRIPREDAQRRRRPCARTLQAPSPETKPTAKAPQSCGPARSSPAPLVSMPASSWGVTPALTPVLGRSPAACGTKPRQDALASAGFDETKPIAQTPGHFRLRSAPWPRAARYRQIVHRRSQRKSWRERRSSSVGTIRLQQTRSPRLLPLLRSPPREAANPMHDIPDYFVRARMMLMPQHVAYAGSIAMRGPQIARFTRPASG